MYMGAHFIKMLQTANKKKIGRRGVRHVRNK
jgi:hypothetical protein